MDRVTVSKAVTPVRERATDRSSMVGAHEVWSRINKEFNEWSTGRYGSKRRRDW